MKRKGFTLVELLVVIAIIALLMSILMPAMARVKAMAYRVLCGTNLSGIGKAMMVYAGENDDRFPLAGVEQPPARDPVTLVSGGSGVMFQNWNVKDRVAAFVPAQNKVTMTSCLYLLVKFADVQPPQFICKGDSQTRAFKLSDDGGPGSHNVTDFSDCWDFGVKPGLRCSYAYHNPFSYPMSGARNGSSPVCADRNPYFDRFADYTNNGQLKNPELDTAGEYRDPDKKGNCALHERDGQNVLFVDGHTEFAKYPNVGLSKDNIYKSWNTKTPNEQQRQLGQSNGGAPRSYRDASLRHERNQY